MSANTSKDPYFCEECGQAVRFVVDEDTEQFGVQCACGTTLPASVGILPPEEWSA